MTHTTIRPRCPSPAETLARIADIQDEHGHCADGCPGWAISDGNHETKIERCDACLCVADGSPWPIEDHDVARLPDAHAAYRLAIEESDTGQHPNARAARKEG